MIAYFDTSAIVPLLVDEPGTGQCQDHWREANRLVSVRLAHAEARAAIAQAFRTNRIADTHMRTSVRELDALLGQLDIIEVDAELIGRAAALAESQALRAYDAVHLAGALTVVAEDLVVVAGDRSLLAAAEAAGLTTARIG